MEFTTEEVAVRLMKIVYPKYDTTRPIYGLCKLIKNELDAILSQ